jgi:hypothetical protein
MPLSLPISGGAGGLPARARLLAVRGHGHSEISNPSTCATNCELSYLQTGAVPPVGTVCRHNTKPFPAPAELRKHGVYLSASDLEAA